MNKLVIFAALVVAVVAEPPLLGSLGDSGSHLVDQALLSKVAGILQNGGDGSADDGTTTQEGAQLVDAELLDRIGRIISQNEDSVGRSPSTPLADLSLPSNNYANTYGGVQPPSFIGSRSTKGPIELGQPQRAHRIASFDITENSGSSGVQVPSTNSYSLPSREGGSETSFSSFQFEQPEPAQRIASFDITDRSVPSSQQESYRPPQARGGPY